MKTEVNVHIGEAKLGGEGVILKALLGSCVGIGFLMPERPIFALSHCLLPAWGKQDLPLGGRYVDQAIDSMLKMMEIEPRQVRRLEAVVAGGGNMTKPEGTDEAKLLGAENARSALAILKEKRIRVIQEDIGGVQGRRISIDCDDGSIDIYRIPRSDG